MKVFRIILFLSLCFSFASSYATHNRAGEITYEWIGNNQSQLKYRITITTYTKTSFPSNQADRQSLDSVYLGDTNTPETFARDSYVDLPTDVRINKYTKEHTYSGPGTYTIRFADPNRNGNVRNIPHSITEPFYVESILKISSQLGNNNSPVMTYPPIDQGCVGRIFIHNPGAFDPDPNDRLTYELVVCGGNDGFPILGYTFPSASHSFSLDTITGTLTWDSPVDTGEYNVAINIKQWRRVGQSEYFVGAVRRDMQILIKNCDNYPPVVDAVADTCVLAGDTLSFIVSAHDPDHNKVDLSASGAPMDANLISDPAHFVALNTDSEFVRSRFTWETKCHHVRVQPYFVQFKAADRPAFGSPTLVDLEGVFIRVIAPGPKAVTAMPNGSSIEVNWLTAPCSGVTHYNIYRRGGLFPDTIHCPCDNGVPSFTGYILIGRSNGSDTTYIDNNNGVGLTIGIEYCYLITAMYADSSESCASPQSCASLKKDAPGITNADVRFTDTNNGSVFVGWSKPTELDTVQFTGPYEYRVFRSSGFFGAAFTTSPIIVLTNLNDTAYVDTLIDTKTHAWSYKIELWYTDSADTTVKFKGQTAVASTIFLSIAPTDNALNLSWVEHVPWTNSRYDIFKQNASFTFDSIASVNTPFFSDTGLVNGTEHCYYIRSYGSYFFSGFVDPILNRSQQQCEIPVDNVHPCSPILTVNSDCNNSTNQLVWTNPNNSCADDVLKYYIFFSPREGGNYELIDSILTPTDTNYLHKDLAMISGCYKVVAIDSVGNETMEPLIVCVDTCRQYVLPSVFTPDGNGANDIFHPCDSTTNADLQTKNCPPYKNVKSVELKIYNRWGNLVFETTDKNINWDGKNKDTKKDCSEGVYYYTCKVNFFSVKNEQSKLLHGTIQLIRR